jgi:hypothetical protein
LFGQRTKWLRHLNLANLTNSLAIQGGFTRNRRTEVSQKQIGIRKFGQTKRNSETLN